VTLPPAGTIAPTSEELKALPDRAARAWNMVATVDHRGGPIYRLNDGSEHVVDLDARTCNCADHEYRGAFCKHLRRAAIAVARGEVPPRDSPRITDHREPGLDGARYCRCEACGLEAIGQQLRRRGCWQCSEDHAEEEPNTTDREREVAADAAGYGGNTAPGAAASLATGGRN
jgi:hypothetical protein